MKSSQRRTSLGRRCAAGAMALLLALGGVPVAPALAEEGIEPAEEPGIEQVIEQDDGEAVEPVVGQAEEPAAVGTVTEVSTANAFMSAIADEGEIKLTGDFDLPIDNALNINKAVIIDLNGHTINVQTIDVHCFWRIYAPVTIKDSASGGAIINPSKNYAFLVWTGGSLTLEGGTLEFTGTNGIDVYMGPFTMTGGVIKSNNHSIWRDGGKVTISGGTINGDFRDTNGEIDITGGSFSFDPSALLKEGYSASKVGDYWVVNAPVYYNVTLSGGANATTSGGATSQTGISGEMATVTYTANTGYYFAEFGDITDNGITAKRTSSTVVTVSGTPTADATITVPDAVEKTAATVTKAPTAKSLTYTGSAQELVTAGTAEGGTMQYALGSDATTAPTDGWDASIPTGTDAGTYHVWYKAVGDGDHADSEPACVDATIADKPAPTSAPTLSCLAHVQGKGDVTASSGADSVVGTTGQSRRLEGMSLALPEGTEGSVRYMVHMQGKGWSQGWVADGAYAGTTGQSRRVEAIRVELTGDLADHYDVWYRVHAQGYGWMGWAKNGAGAGTTGESRRIEAYEVVILPKDSEAPGSTDTPFEGLTGDEDEAPTLSCLAHVQGKGDVTATSGASTVVGTTRQSRRLEGMSLALPDGTEGSVRYMVHTKGKGWSQGWVADGALAGTRHQSRRAEAIRVELDGEVADHYDVWYRVHAQGLGWMGWAKNGAGAGTTGQSRRIEAYEVVLLPKGCPAPGPTASAFKGSL